MKKTAFVLGFLFIVLGCGKNESQKPSNATPPLSVLQDFTNKNEVVADCYFGEPGHSKNATKLTVIKGGKNAHFTAITSFPDGKVISTHYVDGGVTKSVLGIPLALYTEGQTPYPHYPYTISIDVWANKVATGELTTRPLAHGMENHKDQITCPVVVLNP